MKALITGGAGFIGSYLSEALLKKGYKVNVVDNLSTGRLENIQHLRDKPDFSFVEGDILDESLMESLIAEADFQSVGDRRDLSFSRGSGSEVSYGTRH